MSRLVSLDFLTLLNCHPYSLLSKRVPQTEGCFSQINLRVGNERRAPRVKENSSQKRMVEVTMCQALISISFNPNNNSVIKHFL